jgi:hypothetical protein
MADAVAPARGTKDQHRPEQETAEQQQVGERVVGQQVRQCPDLDGQGHRVVQLVADVVVRHVGGGEQHEGHQHQQRSQVPRPRQRGPQHFGALPRQPVAPDDQAEAGQREQRVQALPRAFAAPRDDRAAPVVGDDAHRVHAQEQDQADDQCAHGCVRSAAERTFWRLRAPAGYL